MGLNLTFVNLPSDLAWNPVDWIGFVIYVRYTATWRYWRCWISWISCRNCRNTFCFSWSLGSKSNCDQSKANCIGIAFCLSDLADLTRRTDTSGMSNYFYRLHEFPLPFFVCSFKHLDSVMIGCFNCRVYGHLSLLGSFSQIFCWCSGCWLALRDDV